MTLIIIIYKRKCQRTEHVSFSLSLYAITIRMSTFSLVLSEIQNVSSKTGRVELEPADKLLCFHHFSWNALLSFDNSVVSTKLLAYNVYVTLAPCPLQIHLRETSCGLPHYFRVLQL